MEIKNFAILKGKGVTIEKGRIKIPEIEKTNDPNSEKTIERSPFEVRTDVLFSSGTLECKFKTTDFSTGLLFMFNSVDDLGYLIGLSRNHDSFVISKGLNKIEPIYLAGSLKNYKLNEEHSLKIEIIGSISKLYMDNILICSGPISIKESIIQFRFNSIGSLEIYDLKVQVIKPNIFVIMQFTKEYNELFEDVIKPITEHAGFECIRADEFYTSTPILKDVIESIEKSTAIVAEITPDNPNVFYEIGYSHAISKPTILLCDKKREKLPFDLSSFRTLFYENTIAGKKKVEENLKKYLTNIK